MATQSGSHQEVGLKADAVSLFGDFIVSIANVAPSSSVAFTLALLLSFAGHTSPLAVLVVGSAMFLVSVGYANLNRWRASAGAPYVWVSEAVAPSIGIGTGLLNAITSTLANVGNITLAGVYLLFLISPTNTFSKPITWVVATVIMGTLAWLAIRGIRPTVWLQTTFVVIEYAAVISFVVLALIHEASHAGGATLPGLSDFTVSRAVGGVGGFKGLAEAAVVCGFLYLGWEATANISEESTKRKINPGRAMMLGTGFLTLWYTFLIVVFQGVASQPQMVAHGSDVLAYAGQVLVPGFWGRALPLAVLIAVLGTSQIQMVEGSRVLYAMSRDRLISRIWSRMSRLHQTPWVGLLILAVIPPLVLIPYLASATAFKAIGYVISADGMLGLFMYFVIALASVWFYRAELRGKPGTVVIVGLLPLIGGLFMGTIFFYGLTTMAHAVAYVAIGGVVAAYVLGAIVRQRARSSPFFAELAERRRPTADDSWRQESQQKRAA